MDAHVDTSTALQTAKLLSSASSMLLGGYCLSFSQSTIPSIYDQRPQVTTPAFRSMGAASNSVVPPLTLLSTAASAYLAYAIPEQRREWTTSAITMALTLPWGALVMLPGIKRLHEISQSSSVQLKTEQTLEHRQLMIRWVKQNYVAFALQIVSGVVALRAIIKA